MKLAVVTPWFGRELKGGAEQLAWQMAARLAKRGHSIDVLTTCCRSHQDDWSTNHLPPGRTVEPEGFAVRRFAVDARDRPSFDRVCGYLLSLPRHSLKPGVSPVGSEDANIFRDELIKSQSLLNYLSSHREAYDRFILLPYLYGPIIHAVSIVAERAALQPCLHDEAYAYLPIVAEALYRASLLLFNSDGEQELALRLLGPGILSKSHVVGTGVESEPGFDRASNGSTSAPATRERARDRFVLYLGRKDAGKNVPLLVRAFESFRRVRPNSDLRLVLAGHGSVDLNGSSAITDLGVVSEANKSRLLENCLALVQPSANESFSRTMMEAWRHGRPVAVHASCLATAVAVERSGGGWIAESEDDWASLFTNLNTASEHELARLGESGQRYAHEIADWDKVLDRYERALAPPQRPPITLSRKAATIHQVLPNLSHGDAISNQALFIRDTLRREGFVSNIYVRFIDPRVAHECSLFSPDKIDSDNGIIYHHSIGTELTPHVAAHRGPKLLIYHNITPAEFFEPYRPKFAEILRAGRRELCDLAPSFPYSVADSAFNAEELRECGFANPEVLPICVDPAKWNCPPDPKLMEQLQDGRTNILFVGRIAPNKKQDDLVRVFQSYISYDHSARLILVGAFEQEDPYAAMLRDQIARSGLADSIVMPGGVSDPQLAAYYRTANLFWSMSEHEGFGVPLVEAMLFDVPVLAYKSSAVPETLGSAGMMLTEKSDLRLIAAAAALLIKDVDLRKKIIRMQRERRQAFFPAAIVTSVFKLAATLQPASGRGPSRIKRSLPKAAKSEPGGRESVEQRSAS